MAGALTQGFRDPYSSGAGARRTSTHRKEMESGEKHRSKRPAMRSTLARRWDFPDQRLRKEIGRPYRLLEAVRLNGNSPVKEKVTASELENQ